jgi:hypothetical protein
MKSSIVISLTSAFGLAHTKARRGEFEFLFRKVSLFPKAIELFEHGAVTTRCAGFMCGIFLLNGLQIIYHPSILNLVCTVSL